MKHIYLFIIFTTVFSGLIACSNSPTAQNDQTVETSENINSDTEKAAKKKSDYPAITSVLAQTEIKMVDGSTTKLEDKKGKVILVNLWATWCGPCRGEMPHLIEFQNAHRDKGFEILGLDVDDESVEQINDFAKEMKLNYPLGWATQELFIEFNRVSQSAGSIPQSFLIDRDNNLRGVFVGGSKKVVDQMKETIEKVVNE